MRQKWTRLDNAAKLYPSSGTKTDTHVFRFSCELYEAVQPEFLQKALNKTIERFPVYQYILKRGWFWYYLEYTSMMPIVREEYKPPCCELYSPGQKTLLYEVTYYGNTINMEVYHVLTDGTGAMNFLCLMVTKYLSLVHEIPEPETDYDASHTQMADDSFKRYYKGKNGANNGEKKKEEKLKNKMAYRLKGHRYAEERIKLIRGTVDVKETLKISKEHGATLTTFLSACLIKAIYEEATERAKDGKRPVVLSIPVNLRNYFQSRSARNFFGVIYTTHEFDHTDQKKDLKDIVARINEDFRIHLTPERIAAKMNALFAIEHNPLIRIIPLPLKDFCLRIGYRFTAAKSTATLSNVGIVKIPAEVAEYIRSVDVCTGTNRLQACICTYCDRLSITFTTPFIATDIQRIFFRTLAEFGLHVEIAANQIADE